MLGLLLIYFIGKQFYDLASDFEKNKWLYAILGVLTYYILGFIFTFFIALLDVWVFGWGFDWESSYGMNLLIIPFGLVSVWGLYMILKNSWKKSMVIVKDEIQDIGKSSDE